MRIGILSDRYPTNDAAGAGTIAGKLASDYAKSGHDVTVVTTVPEESAAGTTRHEGVTVRSLPARWGPRFRAYYSLYNPFAVSPFKEVLDEQHFDVVHAHNVHEYLSYHTLKLASDRSIPVVLTYHDTMNVTYGKMTHFIHEVSSRTTERPPASAYRVSPSQQLLENQYRYFPLRNALNRHYLRQYVDYAVAVSHELKRALEVNNVPCDGVIHNGIRPEQFAGGNGERFRDAFGLGDAPILLYGGRVSYWKGSYHLARAFSKIQGLDNQPYLVVIGTDTAPEMRDYAGPDSDRIVTTGWLRKEQVHDAFDAATLVTTPSIYLDPFPTMNLEAMATGTPVVTTCFGGARELVTDGETGLVVNPLATDIVAERVSALLSERDRLRGYQSNTRRHIDDNFSLSNMRKGYINTLKNIDL